MIGLMHIDLGTIVPTKFYCAGCSVQVVTGDDTSLRSPDTIDQANKRRCTACWRVALKEQVSP